jgi:hypothetical protein
MREPVRELPRSSGAKRPHLFPPRVAGRMREGAFIRFPAERVFKLPFLALPLEELSFRAMFEAKREWEKSHELS